MSNFFPLTNRVQNLQVGRGWYSCPETWASGRLDMVSAISNKSHLDWWPHRPMALYFCQSPSDLEKTCYNSGDGIQFLQRQYGRKGLCSKMHKYSTSRESAANASWTLKLSHDIVDYTQTVLSAIFRWARLQSCQLPWGDEKHRFLLRGQNLHVFFYNKSNHGHRYLSFE